MDKILKAKTNLKVKFATNGEKPIPGTVYIAAPDYHLILKQTHMILARGPRENRSRPSIDALFRSAAVTFQSRVTGVVLTGLLDDGTAGLQAIKQCGGLAIIQDPDEAEYPDMPLNAKHSVHIDYISKISQMGSLFTRIAKENMDINIQVPEHLVQEVEISEGKFSADIEKNIIGSPVPLMCPDCGGNLNEIIENNVLRYRCHAGHAYNSLSLTNAQKEQTEYAMWAAVRSLEEQANMLIRLAKKSSHLPVNNFSPKYFERATELKEHAKTIKDFLMHNNRLDIATKIK